MTKKPVVVSEMDKRHLLVIRDNVTRFMQECARRYDGPGRLLDIAPQDHAGAAPYFTRSEIFTLDIDPRSNATYVADLCRCDAAAVPSSYFDRAVCTEVLEHVLDPLAAVRNIHRMLQPGGYVFVTTPFNFRIHGPLPDCWRFTEHGLRQMFKDFSVLSLEEVATPGRDLMPIHYAVVAKKNGD